MDVVAEYAHAYGGPPHADQPWHEVLALVQRTGRFDSRQLLRIMDGTALGQPADTSSMAQRMMFRNKLERAASAVMQE